MLYYSKERAESVARLGALDLWKSCWRRIPLARNEVCNLIRLKQEEDELKVIKILECAHSVSGGIFQKIGLTRDIIKKALAELSRNRKEQTMLCSIICATRFKYVIEG